jgi:hypothetical protein
MSSDPLRRSSGPASFDVSVQYDELRAALLPVFALLGVGLILTEGLTWVWIGEHSAATTGSYAIGLLVLVAVVFGAGFAFVGGILRSNDVRTIRVDDLGVHVVRGSGVSVDRNWDDPSFDLRFQERTPSLGVQASPPPDRVTVVGAGFPFGMHVPYEFYRLTVEAATRHRLHSEVEFEEHHGRFGTHYWWVTSIGPPGAP